MLFSPDTAHLALQIALAFLLDLTLGDPRWDWHPVRLMGKAILAAEKWIRRRPKSLFLGGLGLALGLPLASAGLAWLLLVLARRESTGLEFLVSVILIYFCISARDLRDHALAVLQAVEKGDLPGARKALARIVGRDTAHLDRKGILRACLESVAESTCDGIIAPLFFAFLGGAPLALAYKAVSTLDSMVGYKNEKYVRLGKASARADDAANWIPARLSALLVAGSACFMGLRPGAALAAAWKDGPRQPSPNSGWPEAAYAGALGVRLGGASTYQGRRVVKASLGQARQTLDAGRLRAGIRLMLLVSTLATALFAFAAFLSGR